ncbi:MAG: hypothetical protein ACE5HK_08030 [Candidatus Methylomirabilales bacterium]
MAGRRSGGAIALLALVISVVALIVALLAYQRTGVDLALRDRVEAVRQETADALKRMEGVIRGRDNTP